MSLTGACGLFGAKIILANLCGKGKPGRIRELKARLANLYQGVDMASHPDRSFLSDHSNGRKQQGLNIRSSSAELFLLPLRPPPHPPLSVYSKPYYNLRASFIHHNISIWVMMNKVPL